MATINDAPTRKFATMAAENWRSRNSVTGRRGHAARRCRRTRSTPSTAATASSGSTSSATGLREPPSARAPPAGAPSSPPADSPRLSASKVPARRKAPGRSNRLLQAFTGGDFAPPSATDGDDGGNGQRDIDDEYPAPWIRTRCDFHHHGAPDRPQHPAQRIDRADETERGGPPARRKEIADQAIVTGSRAPPPAPWMARPATMPGRSAATAQTIDPARKSASDAWNASVRPTISESLPTTGIATT